MGAKEYLRQIYKLDILISNKMKTLTSLREQTVSVTATIKDVNVMSTSRNDRLEETICKILDLEKTITDDIGKLAAVKQDVISTIDRVGDASMIDLLYKKYVHHKDWTAIADEMCFSPQNVFRLHGKALLKVQEVLDGEKESE